MGPSEADELLDRTGYVARTLRRLAALSVTSAREQVNASSGVIDTIGSGD